MAKCGEAGEHVVAPYPTTDEKGRRGAAEPEDTDKPEASRHRVESKVGGLS
jgi:hypothetical protein